MFFFCCSLVPGSSTGMYVRQIGQISVSDRRVRSVAASSYSTLSGTKNMYDIEIALL